MRLIEKRGSVFDARDDAYFAHCIASDLRMGAGIAVEFQKKFGLRGKILDANENTDSPTCILTGRVFNLITKRKSSGKPTPLSIRLAVRSMASIIAEQCLMKVAMPRIGCGLDRQSWAVVREILVEELDGIPVVIEVYRLA